MQKFVFLFSALLACSSVLAYHETMEHNRKNDLPDEQIKGNYSEMWSNFNDKGREFRMWPREVVMNNGNPYITTLFQLQHNKTLNATR